MKKFTSDLLSHMNAELQQIAIEAENDLQKAERSFYLIDGNIKKLKEYIIEYNFQDKGEEIAFFKEIKPAFHRELIFFEHLYHIEVSIPNASISSQRKFLQQVLKRINAFFEKHRSLYCYYKSGDTTLDQSYFLRAELKIPLMLVSNADMDANFSTPYSFILAKIQAYEHLRDHIRITISNLGKRADCISGPEQLKRKSVWTDSKSALVELAYALQARGSINNGKSDIKSIVSDLEFLYNVNVGNAYRVFYGMVVRKKSRTPYIDSLKETLERKLDDKDF